MKLHAMSESWKSDSSLWRRVLCFGMNLLAGLKESRRDFYERALQDAQKGDVKAQLFVGRALRWGINGAPRDDAAAETWLKRAAAQGNTDAAHELSRKGLPPTYELLEGARIGYILCWTGFAMAIIGSLTHSDPGGGFQVWSSVTGVSLILFLWEIRKCIRNRTGLLDQEFAIFAPLTALVALSGIAVGIVGLLS